MIEPADAAVLTGPRRLERWSLPCAAPGPDEGWMSVEATGICGSDWPWYAGIAIPKGPTIMGHEVVGSVSHAGADFLQSRSLRVGDRVLVEEAIPCWRCALCLSGRHRLCTAGPRYGSTPVSVEPGLWGGYSTAMYLHPNAVIHRVPDAVPSVLATLALPVANGIDWIGRTAAMHAGDTVVIQGPGQHGLACALAAARLGAGRILVTGRAHDAQRLDIARAVGATDTLIIDDVEDIGTAILAALDGVAPDIVVDAAPLSPTPIEVGVKTLTPGGRLLFVGGKKGAMARIDPDIVFRRELALLGVCARTSKAVTVALNWLAESPATFAPLEADVVSLDEVEKGLLLIGGEGSGPRPIHVVVQPG